eukprot:9156427-Prorocentrum_lima.AAC.1
MAHWHNSFPHELQADEQLVRTVNEHRASAVIKREFDNLTKEAILKHHKEFAEDKLAELKRWQDLNCFRRSPRSESKNRVDGTW